MACAPDCSINSKIGEEGGKALANALALNSTVHTLL